MKVVNEKELKESLKEGLVLVDFFATWCGPCKMMSPILEEISKEVGEKLKIFKVDVDQEEELAKEYGVMMVPTLILFENGEVREKHVGLWQKDDAVDYIKSFLK